MEKKILILNAPLKERIWGGDYFNSVLKKTTSTEAIGEMWSCSGHGMDQSIIQNGYFKGRRLGDVFIENRELFNNSKAREFPILIKLIATEDRLSVQVHPDDDYALKNENQFGKTEGWLILEHKEDSNIVIGHNAANKDDLREYVENDKFDELLRTVEVQDGDFYPIPSGTIHALGKHLVLLEIQQSSDVTYRFYDYHRKDKNGNERELHIDKAIAVTNYKPYDYNIKNCYKDKGLSTLWDNEFFTVKYHNVDGELKINNSYSYAIVTVAKGEATIMGNTLGIGDSAIITSLNDSFLINGTASVVITYSKQ